LEKHSFFLDIKKGGVSRYSPRFLNLQGNKKENKEILNQINTNTKYKLERLASDKQNYSFNRQMNRQTEK
jgi:hypothetical protein